MWVYIYILQTGCVLSEDLLCHTAWRLAMLPLSCVACSVAWAAASFHSSVGRAFCLDCQRRRFEWHPLLGQLFLCCPGLFNLVVDISICVHAQQGWSVYYNMCVTCQSVSTVFLCILAEEVLLPLLKEEISDLRIPTIVVDYDVAVIGTIKFTLSKWVGFLM